MTRPLALFFTLALLSMAIQMVWGTRIQVKDAHFEGKFAQMEQKP